MAAITLTAVLAVLTVTLAGSNLWKQVSSCIGFTIKLLVIHSYPTGSQHLQSPFIIPLQNEMCR